MAKRKASKAKASRPVTRAKGSGRKRPPVDPVTGNGLLFDPVTGEAMRPWFEGLSEAERDEKERRWRRQQAAFKAGVLQRRAARRAIRESRLARRPPEMRSREYALPKSLVDWMRSLVELQRHGTVEVAMFELEMATHDRDSLRKMRDILEQLMDESFVAGCTQGYIEGRVAELGVRRKTSDKLHRRKRERPVSGEMDMDERDAAIFAEVQSLAPELGKEDAERQVAGKHGISDRRVRGIVLEQTVLREYLVLVPMIGEEQASLRVLDKYGVDKRGKADDKRRAAIQKILPKLRLRKLPETP